MSTPRTRASARRTWLLAATSFTIAILAGCAFVTPWPPTDNNNVGDGVSADLGSDIGIRDAVIITDQPNDTKIASFIFTIANNSDKEATVRINYKTKDDGWQAQEVTVPALSHLSRGSKPGDEQMILTDPKARAGGLLDVYASSGSESAFMKVPVLTGEQPQYSDLIPTPSATSTTDPGSSPTPNYEDVPNGG